MENRIVSILINLDGDIIVTYADGTTQNLGPADGLDPESILAQCQAAQAAAAEAAAAAVAAVESIPADYTELAADVENLKTDVTGIETALESKADTDALDALESDITDLSETKADKDGVYDYLTAGLATQLATDQGVTDSVPYLMRPSGGGVAVGTYEQDKIVGGSIVWNQLIQNGDFSNDFSGWSNTPSSSVTVANGVCKLETTTQSNRTHAILQDFAVVSGRKYFCTATIKNLMSDAGTFALRYFVSVYINCVSASIASGETKQVSGVFTPTADGTNIAVGIQAHLTAMDVFEASNVMFIDLTQMFGATVADYIYSIEQATPGAGVAWLKQHFPKQFDSDSGYQEYNSGEIKSVSGLVSHTMRDADDNIIGSYPLDSTLTLRGLPKITDGKLSYDGDIYLPEGTVERRYAERAYESGDESLTDALTDGTVTVYKMTTPTTETAPPYQTPQLVDPDGTEEYVLSAGAFPMPVGHETLYPENLKEKLEGLPWNFSNIIAPTESGYTAGRPYTSGDLFIVDNILYKAVASIAAGATITPGTNCTATTVAAEIKALQ